MVDRGLKIGREPLRLGSRSSEVSPRCQYGSQTIAIYRDLNTMLGLCIHS